VSRVHGARLTGLRNSESIRTLDLKIYGPDLISRRGIFNLIVAIYSRMGGWDFMRWQSNLECWLQDQLLGSNQPKGYAGSNPSRWLQDGRCRGVAGEVAALSEPPWRRHGRSSSAKPISRYGAPSWTGFLPTGVVGLGELTRGVFSRRGAPEQGVRWRGSSFDLRLRWQGASRSSFQ
jgi:hypothetical protein